MNAEEAFKRIAGSCFGHLLDNQECALHGEDPGGVHQMRVASRRLRSAISLFRGTLPAAWTEAVAGELKWFTIQLAAAREWDVFLRETHEVCVARIPGEESLAELGGLAENARRAAYANVRRAVGSDRYTRMLLALGRAVEAPLGIEAAGRPVPELADSLTEKRYRKVRKRGKRLARLDAPGLHALRIQVKKLRYACEFFSSLHADGAEPESFIAALRHLQDALGYLNDVAVTPPLLEPLPASPAIDRARGIVAGWQAAQEHAVRANLRKLWKAFKGASPFWRA